MNESRYLRLVEDDHRYLWHPFTQMRAWLDDQPIVIERGEGNYLIDVNGRRFLDGVSSLWCNVHGHRKAELDQALIDQAGRIAHSTMLGLSNVPAIELGQELVSVAPAGLKRVFYSDSGAEAVEVALRMAVQYWQQTGARRRKLFLALTESYHGDTVGAASLGYSEMFHRYVRPVLFSALKTDPPVMFRLYRGLTARDALVAALEAAKAVIERHREDLAALVIEPMVQGAAGMWTHPAEYLREMARLAREAGALVIFDEVATGFGRTGKMFACEHAQVSPDLLCLGKGITGGYLPLAATLATERIFDAFLGDIAQFRAFYYGHTYTGNPLAAAVAVANLKLFRDEALIERLAPRIALLSQAIEAKIAALPHVADIRQCGLMVGIELMRDVARRERYDVSSQMGAKVARAARKGGVLIRPLGDVVVLMPPLSITDAEIEHLVGAVAEAITEVTLQHD
jgi:adenosylmethionine-8-amino-7-oxononanoate aminotransferase